MASELKVDTIKHTNNTTALSLDTSGNVTASAGFTAQSITASAGFTAQSISASSFLNGQIIQTVTSTAGIQATTTSGSFTSIGSLEVQITPLLASSDIYLMVCSTGHANASSAYAKYDFYKNASDVTETNNLSGVAEGLYHASSASGTAWTSIVYMFQDVCSENSTSTKTYRPTFKSHSTSGGPTIYFGWSATATSSLHAFEIKR